MIDLMEPFEAQMGSFEGDHLQLHPSSFQSDPLIHPSPELAHAINSAATSSLTNNAHHLNNNNHNHNYNTSNPSHFSNINALHTFSNSFANSPSDLNTVPNLHTLNLGNLNNGGEYTDSISPMGVGNSTVWLYPSVTASAQGPGDLSRRRHSVAVDSFNMPPSKGYMFPVQQAIQQATSPSVNTIQTPLSPTNNSINSINNNINNINSINNMNNINTLNSNSMNNVNNNLNVYDPVTLYGRRASVDPSYLFSQNASPSSANTAANTNKSVSPTLNYTHFMNRYNKTSPSHRRSYAQHSEQQAQQHQQQRRHSTAASITPIIPQIPQQIPIQQPQLPVVSQAVSPELSPELSLASSTPTMYNDITLASNSIPQSLIQSISQPQSQTLPPSMTANMSQTLPQSLALPQNIPSTSAQAPPFIASHQSGVPRQQHRQPSSHLQNNKIRTTKYQCAVCSKAFTTSGHLARHNRIHTGEKNYMCPHSGCGSKFSRQDNCMQHYRTHSNAGLKPIKKKRAKKT